MKIIKDVNGLLEELAGPSIEQAGNEEAVVADDATKDAAQEIDGEKTNTEVYPSDEHEQTEEVKEVVVTEGMNDEQLKEALLKAGYKTTELDEALAELKEELAGPSIEQAGNEEAVVEQDATKEEVKADDAEQTNTDVYTSDEHEQTEEVKEVEIKEELAGPSIEQAGNEEAVVADDATKETAQEADAEQTNTDVYPSDEHEQVEEVKEVQVTESCSKGAAKKMKVKVIKEDALEEPAAATENDAVISDAPAADGADAANDLAVENGTEAADTQDITNPAEETAAEIDGLLSDNSAVDTLSEGFKKLFEGLNRINDILKEEGPAVEQAGNEESKVEKDATKDSVETDDAEKTNTDVYCDCTHTETEDVEDVEIKENFIEDFFSLDDDEAADLLEYCEENEKELYNALTEAINILNDPTLNESLDDVSLLEKVMDKSVFKSTNNEIKSAKIKYANNLYKNAKKAIRAKYAINKKTLGKAEAKQIKKASFSAAKKFKNRKHDEANTEYKTNKELYAAAKAKDTIAGVRTATKKEQDKLTSKNDALQTAIGGTTAEAKKNAIKTAAGSTAVTESLAGPSIEQAGNEKTVVEDDALKDTAAEMTGEKTNTEVYPSDEHKQVEEVVDIVVEAAIYCREHNIETSRENVAKAIRTLHESENISIDFADKSYDVDADIESAEKLGDDTNNKEYEDLQGEGSDAAKAEESEVTAEDVQESVKYNSLKEACMLDEGYFWNDSVTVNTASEKVEKLKEQVSLLIARENADPRYDELLKHSIAARRLQESICNEYSDVANDRVNLIIGEEANRSYTNDDIVSKEHTKYKYYTDKATGERRVQQTTTLTDRANGQTITLKNEDRLNRGKSGRDYGPAKSKK